MQRKQITILSVAVALLLLGMFLLFGGGKRYNWWEHYRPESKDPYGTYIVQQLLKGYFPNEKFEVVKDSLKGNLKTGNYIFVGNWLWLDSLQTDALLKFVAAGNQAFIASNKVSLPLLDSIAGRACWDYPGYDEYEDEFYDQDEEDYYAHEDYIAGSGLSLKDTAVALNFEHPALAMDSGLICKYAFQDEVYPYSWGIIPADYFCEEQTNLAVLGTLNQKHINFARAKYGDGAFYFHTTPLAFTNYYLLEEQGLDYAGRAFSHLAPGPIYWDHRQMHSFPPSSRSLSSEGPLKYILAQPPLAWAWYILLGMALLYLIFRAKRRQRIIPVLEQNTNTSLEFIGTIGRLFFLQNNHKQLALQKMKLFLGFVRERYHLSTKELDGTFTRSLAVRSETPEETIQKIIKLHRNIASSGYVSENVLTDFHRLMEGFYKNCK